MASASLERFAELVRVIMKSERLDELPEASGGSERSSFVSRLLKSENLPFDEIMPGARRAPRASGLFASEPLPFDDISDPRKGRASFIATLFTRERLPEDPAPGPGPVGRGSGH